MTTIAENIVKEARRLQVRLERRGDMIGIVPRGRAPREFVELVREHKPEILSLLEASVSGLKQDEAPWLHVAKQVLAGEFDGMDGSTREALVIGLRSITHPTCREALEKLRGQNGRV